MLADDPNSNPFEVYIFLLNEFLEKNEKGGTKSIKINLLSVV